METVHTRIIQVQENIARACGRVGRRPDDVTLVAVTKFAAVEKIRQAIEAGVKHIGENRIQAAEEHFTALGDLGERVTRHMIGHLQTNKVKTAIQIFNLIQSVDSEKLVLEIERRAAAQGQTQVEILIEVNSGEEQKSGVAKSNLDALLAVAANCEHVHVKGFMTMAPLTDDKELVRQAFRDLRILSQKAAAQFKSHLRIQMKYLSMGMTGDYEIAIEEGATMVRIGSAIFNDK